MEVAFFWIVLCFLVAYYGSKRKIGGGWAFFWSLILSPLIGFIIAAAYGDKEPEKPIMIELIEPKEGLIMNQPYLVEKKVDNFVKIAGKAEMYPKNWFRKVN